MKKVLKKIQTIYFCIKFIHWKKFFKLYSKNATTILWYYPKYRKNFYTQSIEREFGIINAFIELDIPFKIYFGKKIGQFHNSTIFFMSTVLYDEYKFDNYTTALSHISKQLEAQGNYVYPTSHEAMFWENKIHMHQQFKEHGINEPKTTFLTKSNLKSQLELLKFPLLIKEPHSCSSLGIYKISSKAELENLLTNKKLLEQNEAIIAQQLINMRRDMRVTIVGEDDICLHYWRINKSKEWKPTATGYGSDVDFINFPEKWRSHILHTMKKLNLTSCGIDMTFENDDITTEPIFLEVSPFYQPNPPVDISKLDCPYGVYKKQFKLKNSWDKKFVEIIYTIELKLVKYFLNKKPS
ncbi:MAG TPA: hypothetical protein PKG56_05995 [Chitinophagaceae bacterium]|nr:hypothetical protein [Chitinophagaceae bacterium]MCC6635788.1 hypothetical protein [Chitinophagaceae bacterium]HMZ47071.1 hypothetical protein [Chitinophagaceae bacterium]HNE92761.1 hypothetical protein [Chitinophagaceae bacterium]HNJ57744.1 hypothetical protein [Chitinophagaceae bacterium]